jgi:hypothetical protein
MLNSKICREHAAKCIETAEAIPPGAQREMFFDMAKRWTDLAINIESREVRQVLKNAIPITIGIEILSFSEVWHQR